MVPHVKLVLISSTKMNPEKRTILPGLAFKGFASRYQRPELSEGFQDVTEVAFKVRASHAIAILERLLIEDLASSSMVAKPNGRYGLRIGFEELGRKKDIVHELPCGLHAFSRLRLQRVIPILRRIDHTTRCTTGAT